MLTLPYNLEASTPSLIVPIHEDYQNFNVPVKDCFPWGEALEAWKIPIGEAVALVTFRSIPNPEADPERLRGFDERALLAAKNVRDLMHDAGGLIEYGPWPDFSWCAWGSFAEARLSAQSKEHREAAACAPEAYIDHRLERWFLRKYCLGGRVELIQLR